MAEGIRKIEARYQDTRQPFEYYEDLAQITPKIPFDDERIAAGLDNHPLHQHNELYLLWKSLQPDCPEGSTLLEHYRDKGEYNSHGISIGTLVSREQWENFLQLNADLDQQIADALRDLQPYEELQSEFYRLLSEGNLNAIDQLNKATGHPLGVDAIGYYAWDQLNPLLEEAAQKMREAGIEPRNFFNLRSKVNLPEHGPSNTPIFT